MRTNQSSGFTLIELVLMVALLGIMVVFYVESAGNLSDIAVDGASRKAQSDLRYAQVLAQTTGVMHGAKFTSGGSYQVYSGTVDNIIADPQTGKPLVEQFDNFPGVSLATNYQVEFNANGKPTMGADQRARFSSSSGAIRDVYVVDQTGAVVVDLIQAGTGCSCELCKQK
ncbi:MAG: hypothetical protein HYT75_06845 [Deltaproteobacteria bacterium]|nr:hypothetical protein [Deltaproteobacteria bacterium]MBI2342037.1 hypothetical protein [Deltaproteobacteria bacterium]